MGTSTSKALRRAIRGEPSKISLRQGGLSRQRQYGEDKTVLKNRSRRKQTQVGTSNLQVSPSGRSSRGLAASVPRRVSHAHRGPQHAHNPQSAPRGSVARKRANSKTANPRGRYSNPEMAHPIDKKTLGRPRRIGRKATARIPSLRKA